MFTKDRFGASHGDNVSPLLAHPDVVYPIAESINRTAHTGTGDEGCSNTSPKGSYSFTKPQTSASGMQSIREHLTNYEVPADIAAVLRHSWRLGTQKQYDVYIKMWSRKINSLQPHVIDVLTYLHEFHIRKLSYSAINTARSALLSYLMGFQFSSTSYTVSKVHTHLLHVIFKGFLFPANQLRDVKNRGMLLRC